MDLELTPERVMKMGKKYRKLMLLGMTPEERLKGLRPEEVLKNFKSEELLAGISVKEIEAYLKKLKQKKSDS